MKNPWIDLPSSQPYLLPSDRDFVLSRNIELKEPYQIKHNVLPEPYIGNPEAPIILLVLNPGYKDEDVFFYQQKPVFELWRKNIFHESTDYPFWMLNPSLNPEIGGTNWWLKKLKEPIDIAGLKQVANSFCCIEYFPYHSRKYNLQRRIFESQKYGFYLVEKAMQRDAVIILARSKNLWFEAVPELSNYKFLFGLNSVQNITISRNNCPNGFPFIEKVLA